jgi:hypothetical protein
MARPVKPIKRQKKLTLYYTRAEYAVIDRLAERHGLTKAEYARLKSLDCKLKPRLTPQECDFYRKLTGMANNLNQLAHAVNRGEVFTRNIMEAIEAIKFTVAKLR